MVIELVKVVLWFESQDVGWFLVFFDYCLCVGNSLLGVMFELMNVEDEIFEKIVCGVISWVVRVYIFYLFDEVFSVI